MKNKRYKRVAKRIIGNCINTKYCVQCKTLKDCMTMYSYEDSNKFKNKPYYTNVRDIEKALKGVHIKS